MSKNSTFTNTRKKLTGKMAALLLAIVFACSLVGLTPSFAATKAVADDDATIEQSASAVQSAAARNASFNGSPLGNLSVGQELNGIKVVGLELDNASLSLFGQTVSAPARAIAIPSNKDFDFEVIPVEGYEISAVQFQKKADAITEEETQAAEALNRVAGLYDIVPVEAEDETVDDAAEPAADVYTILQADLGSIETIIVKAVPVESGETTNEEPTIEAVIDEQAPEGEVADEIEVVAPTTSEAAGAYVVTEDGETEEPAYTETYDTQVTETAPEGDAPEATEEEQPAETTEAETPAPYQAETYNEAATLALQGVPVLDPEGNLLNPSDVTSRAAIPIAQTLETITANSNIKPVIESSLGSNFSSSNNYRTMSNTPATIANVFTTTGSAKVNDGNITGDGDVTINGTYNGHITIAKGANITLKGNGTINADKTGTSAITVQNGATFTLQGDVIVKNGIGTLITTNDTGLETRGSKHYRVGGGVYVVGTAKFNLKGGTITDNTAQRGGGIFIDKNATFNMTGGNVTKNSTVDLEDNEKGSPLNGDKNFAGEGGGIFIWGTATISGGEITYNTCNSTSDLGGGGIYINNGGIATIINAKIINNTADGFGGGIAGCCHGETALVATDGVALYDNTAKGEARVRGKTSTNYANGTDKYTDAVAAGINGSTSSDFYNAGNSIINNYMAGGGSENYTVTSTSYNGTIADSETEYLKGVVGLTANPTQDSKDAIPHDCVLIEDNESTAHGGGIGCNGVLVFGSHANRDETKYALDLVLDVNKNLDGAKLEAEKYTFGLFDKNDKQVATATNDANGKIQFTFDSNDIGDKIKNDKPDSYTESYTLREVISEPEDESVIYDKSEYTVEVTFKRSIVTFSQVFDHTTDSNKPNEVTVITTTYKYTPETINIIQNKDKDGKPIAEGEQQWKGEITDSSKGVADTGITFNNVKKGTLVVTKDVIGGGDQATDKEYTFTVTGPSYPDGTEVNIKGNGSKTLENLIPGTYTVTEVRGENDENIAINGYNVYVDGGDTVNVRAGGFDKATVTNTYEGWATWSPEIEKSITTQKGVTAPGETFTFYLLDEDGKPVLDENNNPISTTIVNGGNWTENVKQAFDHVFTYKEEGEHTYKIVEDLNKSKTPGYTYDPIEWTVDVKVSKNTEGNLEAHATYTCTEEGNEIKPDDGKYYDAATFNNIFTEVSASPWVTKEVAFDGDLNQAPHGENDFIFTIAPSNPADAPMPKTTTLKSDYNGSLNEFQGTFGEIDFTEPGTYVYTITEKPGDTPGWIYDKSTWTYTVVVDAIKGQLEITSESYESDGNVVSKVEGATFSNTFKPGKFQPEITKTIETKGNVTAPNETFSFMLKGPNGKDEVLQTVTIENRTGELVANGKALFDTLTFDKPGEYTYTIVEKAGETPGYDYDPATFTFTVVVVPDETGALVATCPGGYTKVSGDGTKYDSATFNNEFTPTEYAPKVDKVIDGAVPEGAEKTFDFTLEQVLSESEDGRFISGKVVSEKTVKGDGEATFDEQLYTTKGDYKYLIKEKRGSDIGYTYDESVWTVVVTVGEKDGNLVIEKATYTKDGVTPENEAATFTNEYFEPEKVETTPGDGVQVGVGDEITYNITWKNYKNEPATVVVTDNLDDGVDFVSAAADMPVIEGNTNTHVAGVYDDATHTVTWNLGEQPARAQGTLELKVKVNENAITAGNYGEMGQFEANPNAEDHMVYNQAGVKVDNDSTFTNIPQNPVPEKKETIPGNGELVGVGDEIDYVIHWKNGQDQAAKVTITDPLEAGVDFVSAGAGEIFLDGKSLDGYYGVYSYDKTSHVVTWTFKDAKTNEEVQLPAGAEGDVMLKVRVNEKAPLLWQYEQTEGSKDYEVVNRAHVQVGNDFKITNEVENPVPEKTEVSPGNRQQVSVGSEITYNIHWKNGEVKPATVVITDELDQGVDFVTANNGGQYDEATRTVTWNIGQVDPGAEGDVQLTVKVNEKAYNNGSYKEGDYTGTEGKDYEVENQAAVWFDNNAAFTTVVENPVPEKTETTPGDGELVGVGDQIDYAIHWKNGEAGAANVVITDQLDKGVTFLGASYQDVAISANETHVESGDITIDYNADSHTVTWTLKNQAAGLEGDVNLSVVVNGDAYKTGGYDADANFGMTEGDAKDYDVQNQAKVQVGNSSAVTTMVENPVPEKTEATPGDGQLVKVGDEITYNIYWKNNDNQESIVTIEDPLDPGVEFVSAAFAGGDVSYTADDTNLKRVEVDVDGTTVIGSIEYDPTSRTVTWSLGEELSAPPVPDGTNQDEGNTIHGVPAGSQGYVTLTVKVTEKAFEGWQYEEVGAGPYEHAVGGTGTEGRDYKVDDRAAVQLNHGAFVHTQVVTNPVTEPKKEEVTPGDDENVNIGDEITYEITWQNFEDEAATVTITDELDIGVDFVSAAANMPEGYEHPAGVYSPETRTVTWVIYNCPALSEGKVELKVKVNDKARVYGTYGENGQFVQNPGMADDFMVYNQAGVKVGENHTVYTEIPDNDVPIVDLSAIKVWADSNEKYQKHPGSVLVQPFVGNQPVGDQKSLNDANNWYEQWLNLPKYDADGKLIQYTVKETVGEDMNLYDPVVTERGANYFVITNTIQLGDLEVTKLVTGDEADADKEFTFTVTLDGDPAVNGTYGGMTFVDNVATFTLKDGQTVTGFGLPAGLRYTVTETDYTSDGYETVAEGETGAIAANKVVTANFVNNKASDGSLTVTKIHQGDDRIDPEKEFHFTVTLDDTSVDGVHGGMTFENGVASFTLKGGDSVTATELPEGVTYTVTEQEANQDGYVTRSNGANGEIVADDSANAVFVNERYTTGLDLSKTVVSDDENDRARDFHFAVELDDPTINDTYGDLTFTNGHADVTLRHGQTAHVDGLPAGVHYTVTEAEDGQDGFTTYKNGDEGDLVSGTTSNANFNNVRTDEDEELGALSVYKVVRGGPADTATNRVFTFTVTGPDGYSRTVNVTGSGSTVLDGLEPGDYQIVEQNAAIDGYSWTVEVVGSTTVEAGAESAAYVFNIYEEEIPGGPTPSGGQPGNATNNQETINDNYTPLTNRQPSNTSTSNATSPQVEETIDDLAVPLASTPKTGDERNLGLWIGIGAAALVAAGVCAAGFVISIRRRKNDEE